MIADPLEKAAIRQLCIDDHLFFTSYFFKIREGIKFKINWHHVLVADVVERIINGQSKNVIINVSPGSSKTEMVVINLIARGLAINHRSRFLHISYSDDLTLLNSKKAKEIIESDEYQELWPIRIADDSRSKKLWNVVLEDKAAGGLYAVSLGGQITGFRAGHMAPGFQGAILIDDPLKVDDAYSATAKEKANRLLVSTVKSRKANPDTPIVIIMQRLAEEDPTGFIKSGEMPGEWEFIEIPAIIDDQYVAALPDHIARKVDSSVRDEHGRFSYWPYKEPLEDLLQMETLQPYVFAGQYMQRPSPLGGNIIRGAWFGRYTHAPNFVYRKIFADTAQKTAEHNDYSVFQCWGKTEQGHAYLIDQIRGKWEAPELKRRALAFWAKHTDMENYPPHLWGSIRQMVIEDKASGTGLIQDLRISGSIPVVGVERVKDKVTRVLDVVGYIEAGRVFLPDDAPFTNDFVAECEAFTPNDTHAHDDQIDPMCDAVNDMVATGNIIDTWAKMAE